MTDKTQKILMCPPDHFGVNYVINPWMEGQIGTADLSYAKRQWQTLHDFIARQCEVVLQPPQSGLPDLVFTANAGLVLGNKAIVSRFRNTQRQGEEAHDRAWFAANNFDILDWPSDVPFEGAGDALFDRGQDLLWVGQGFRSDPTAPALLEKMLGRKTVALTLIDPRFYHLDTCLCPLQDGFVIYYPAAFDEISRAAIEAHVPADKRIPVGENDATQFCCNAVDINRHVFLNGASTDLQDDLRNRGFTPMVIGLSEFMKAGGGAKCLTLKLVEA